MGKQKKRQKVAIVFDEQKRKEFLTGFSKRKNERKKKAKEQIELMLKQEKKLIKSQLKDGLNLKAMKKTFQPLQELTEEDKMEKFEDDEVEVKIVELAANDFALKGNMIGANIGVESEEEDQGNHSDEESEIDANTIPGMDLVKQKKKPKKPTKSKGATENKLSTSGEFKSKKEIDALMKKKTIKKLKVTSAFKQKQRFEQVANRKKFTRMMNNTIKSLPKHKQMDAKKRFSNGFKKKDNRNGKRKKK